MTSRHNLHLHYLQKRDEGQNTCQGNSRTVYNAALSEVPRYLNAAELYLLRIHLYLDESMDTDVEPAAAEVWAAVQLFEAIFGGPLLYQPKAGDTAAQIEQAAEAQRAASEANVDKVLDIFQNVIKGLQLEPLPYNTYCDESWYDSIENVNPQLAASDPNLRNVYTDIRAGAPTKYIRWRDFEICWKNPDRLAAFVTHTDYMWDQPMLTLCPNYLVKWVDAYYQDVRFARDAARDWYTDIPENKMSLQELYGGEKYMVTSLMHELMHINPLVHPIDDGDSNNSDDDTDMFIEDVETTLCPEGAYGWDCVTDLARNLPHKAVQNADNFAYFIIGAVANKNNWATGWAEPLVAQPSN